MLAGPVGRGRLQTIPFVSGASNDTVLADEHIKDTIVSNKYTIQFLVIDSQCGTRTENTE